MPRGEYPSGFPASRSGSLIRIPDLSISQSVNIIGVCQERRIVPEHARVRIDERDIASSLIGFYL